MYKITNINNIRINFSFTIKEYIVKEKLISSTNIKNSNISMEIYKLK